MLKADGGSKGCLFLLLTPSLGKKVANHIEIFLRLYLAHKLYVLCEVHCHVKLLPVAEYSMCNTRTYPHGKQSKGL